MNNLKTFYNHAAYLEAAQLTYFSEKLTTFSMDSNNAEDMKLTLCNVNKNEHRNLYLHGLQSLKRHCFHEIF